MQLSLGQRIKRRIWLLKGSYTHPDGTIELDFDEKAGIDPTRDSEEVQDRKLDAWHKREASRQRWWSGFVVGAVVGGLVVHYWP
jgi:hypothetical protein